MCKLVQIPFLQFLCTSFVLVCFYSFPYFYFLFIFLFMCGEWRFSIYFCHLFLNILISTMRSHNWQWTMSITDWGRELKYTEPTSRYSDQSITSASRYRLLIISVSIFNCRSGFPGSRKIKKITLTRLIEYFFGRPISKSDFVVVYSIVIVAGWSHGVVYFRSSFQYL